MSLVLLMLTANGDRALGVEVAQVLATAKWLKQTTPTIRLESSGPRSQMVALIAAALEPSLFGGVVNHQGMGSLRELLDGPLNSTVSIFTSTSISMGCTPWRAYSSRLAA